MNIHDIVQLTPGEQDPLLDLTGHDTKGGIASGHAES